ncbi:EF-hand, partial [Ramicandelaber brevisporus]
LASETEFNSTELQGLAEVWMNLAIEQDSSNGGKGIDWAVFQKCMGRLAIEKSAYITSLFRIYDSDGDGLIGFPEMVKTISVLERGDLLKKSQLAFHFYDLNGDGSITIDELRTMLLSYFNL